MWMKKSCLVAIYLLCVDEPQCLILYIYDYVILFVTLDTADRLMDNLLYNSLAPQLKNNNEKTNLQNSMILLNFR